MDVAADFPAAAFFVIKGTNADKAYVCTNDAVTVGVTAVTFTQFAGAGSSNLTASGGLQRVADDISITTNCVAGDTVKLLYDGTYYYVHGQQADNDHITLA